MYIPPTKISKEKISLYLCFIFFTGLTFFSREVPFFWDELFYSLPAHYIYDSNFSSIIPASDDIDSQNCLTYGMYLAVFWKLFGKSLLVSHFCMLPVLLCIVWEYYRFSKKFISSGFLPYAFVLLIFDPVLITQSIFMSHDLFFVFFFLLCLNSLLENKKITYSVALCILVVGNIRGELAGVFFFFVDIFLLYNLKKKISFRFFIPYLSVGALFALWLFYHHSVKGWYYLSPETNLLSETFSVRMVFKRIIFGLWQIIDFGRIFLWLFVVTMFFYLWGKNNLSSEIKRLFSITIILVIIFTSIIAILQSIPVCHRYFLPVFLLSSVLVCALLEKTIVRKKGGMTNLPAAKAGLHPYVRFDKLNEQNRTLSLSKGTYVNLSYTRKKLRRILVSIFCIALLTGNFWIYGGGFSNGWDSSLKILPYFKLRNQMDEYVNEQKINPVEIGTKFPLYQDKKYAELSAESFHYSNMQINEMEKYNYVLLSNVSNLFTVLEKENLKKNWELEKEFRSGLVYLKLFKNKNGFNE